MRITNKIMQNNSLTNINNTKVAQDTLSSQISSGKKIVRPSDDPIVAIRALRLRSSVTEISQYYKSNVPDAEAWLNTTEDAMQQVTEVITDMLKQYTKGSNEYLKSSDRQIILEQLKSLRDEVYATGDADYAGRYVFTGYRTETSLKFTEDVDMAYEITEQLSAADLKMGTHVSTSFKMIERDADGNPVQDTEANGDPKVDSEGNPVYKTQDMDLANMQEGTQKDYIDVVENDIATHDYYRIRLSYSKCDDMVADGFVPKISYLDEDGNVVEKEATKTAKSTDIPSPYDMDLADDDIVYLADTGELLIGKNIYETLSGLKDDPLTENVNEGEIRVTYQKSSFNKGDLRPEHYFYCISGGEDNKLDTTNNNIEYNPTYLTYSAEKQIIEYDVGFNQRLQVNTTADECFDPAIGREIDDVVKILENVDQIENVVTTLEGMLEKSTDEDEKKVLQQQLDAANKAFTYAKENLQKVFESGISVMQGFLDQVNVAVTNCGARGSRLELIKSRLSSQQTTFDTLKSDNEDADLAEVAVQLTSAELTYEAALKATGKIMQTNLMDFI
ncbi:MAG: hypothetical protein ACI4FV_06560 [Lachnospiraceae bacterium]